MTDKPDRLTDETVRETLNIALTAIGIPLEDANLLVDTWMEEHDRNVLARGRGFTRKGEPDLFGPEYQTAMVFKPLVEPPASDTPAGIPSEHAR
ncbi:hypothetical protein [Bifidobacterium felsineum]|uniref:hypothetical protein n=1 Tax=Bifidobacterium felsineum TaxID=2045440 RepID=UPI001BDD4AE5|nr:hypothetical protein [Bifidobacterium felsineum]MBT1164592.1 hypothetical protein [Bifidobacterium felsineum]